MMKWAKNKTLARTVVIIVALGLVMAYVPLLFAPETPQTQPTPQQPKDTPPADNSWNPSEVPTSTPTPSVLGETLTPQESFSGFSGLETEQQSLDELDTLLGN